MSQYYARVVDGTAAEIFAAPEGFGIGECFHPAVAAQFVVVPASVVVGSKLNEAGTWIAPPAPPQVSAPLDTRITRLAFLNRMTGSERIAIRAAAADGDVVISDILDLLSAATFIDLSRNDLISSIDYLKSKSLLTPERAFSILNNPIQDAERLGT